MEKKEIRTIRLVRFDVSNKIMYYKSIVVEA